MGTTGNADRILRLASERGLVRARDLAGHQIPRATLSRLVASGRLVQISRGLYALPKHSRSEQYQLAEIAARTPHGVFCLLTALRFHELTTQSPHDIWLAIPNKARPPKLEYPPLRVVRFSGQALTKGVETHIVDGVTIRVYSVAKTVADCFKYRNKTGLDVALEALRESRREKRATNDELWRYAKICRVANVMRPYMESLE
ncbi:MAG: transcriptional regulator [Bacillati bacterium ANGP1]|uniref:Transcriptional regulator n=1 Tax=Candidatus Segetimicrobium genomatis TaxID=2569760 RepID=A0A537JJ92_9BACT|nr:MAG: transcriptional regulator [Terrabacteria group bacterium ANGP1]